MPKRIKDFTLKKLEEGRFYNQRVTLGVSLVTAVIILLVFLGSEPLRLFWSHVLRYDFEFDEQWSATLNNMVMIAVGFLLGTNGKHQEPAQRSPYFRTRKTDLPELTDEVEPKDGK